MGDAVLMISLEPMRPGTASSTHFEAIATGLSLAGHAVHQKTPNSTRLPRPLEMAISQIQFVYAGLRYERIYARWHVLDLSVIVLALLGKRVVLEVNGKVDDIMWAHPKLKPLEVFISRLAALQFRLATGIVAVSPGLAEWVSNSSGNSRVRFAHNGADLSLAKYRNTPAIPRYAVFVGELAPWQGIGTILAARTSASWPKELGLVVVGDGTLAGDLAPMVARGLVDHRGRIERREALQVLSEASVSLSPQLLSIDRNWVMGRPLKISESLILGVPCIATAFPDSAAILRDLPGCGVIDTDDPEALARAAARAMHTTEDERFVTASQAQSRCSWSEAILAAESLLYERAG